MKWLGVSTVVVAFALSNYAFAQNGHKIGSEAAAKAALKRFPGKLVKKAKLEHEDGQWQYEVLIRYKGELKEVNVGAYNGKIASVETTSAKEEAKEGAETKSGKGG